MEFVNTPGTTRPLAPQAVVLLDPATGVPVPQATPALDSTGAAVNPEAWSHAYAYDAAGLLLTDSATNGTSTWIKTYSYNSAGLLTGETKWVKQ